MLFFSVQELFPINKRSQEAFLNHFQEAGLGPVANLQVSCINFISLFGFELLYV